MHDAVALEQRGRPTAVIVTETFVEEARSQLAALGMEGLTPVVIRHPLSTLPDEEIAGRALEAAPQVERVLLGKPRG